ncbi:hypothetical protein MYA_3507 [Burkholderia sp. KJ006]|nr:hypothetical protein MYA_3507 [Burkholderia sp. KJ006]
MCDATIFVRRRITWASLGAFVVGHVFVVYPRFSLHKFGCVRALT